MNNLSNMAEQRGAVFNKNNIYMCLMVIALVAKRVIESKGTPGFEKNYQVYSQLDDAIRSHRDMSDGMLWELDQERHYFDDYLQKKTPYFNDETILNWYKQWLYDLNFAEMFE